MSIYSFNNNISYQSYEDFQNQTNGNNILARQSIDTYNYDLDETSRNNQSPLVSFQTNKFLVIIKHTLILLKLIIINQNLMKMKASVKTKKI
jgi:hypothetical protein